MMSSKIPASPAEITPAWMASALGTDVSGLRAERIGEAYGLSSTLYRCRLSGSGVPPSVVVKLWVSERAVDLREVPFYRELAPGLGVRVPRCYYGAIDATRAVLVLEDLEHAKQGDCLEQLDARGAATMARVLAGLHATWWERPELASTEWLPPMSVRTKEWLVPRRAQCLETIGDRLPSWVRQWLERVEEINARALDLLEGAPQTLLHADLHLDNVLFEGDAADPILIDWARVARGPAAIDLVELLFSIAPAWRPALEIYLDEMQRRRVGIDEAAWHRVIGGALLRRFISATCGVSRWEWPSERERRLVETDQARVFRAVEQWRERDGGGFGFSP